jgi:hypothetical protein
MRITANITRSFPVVQKNGKTFTFAVGKNVVVPLALFNHQRVKGAIKAGIMTLNHAGIKENAPEVEK